MFLHLRQQLPEPPLGPQLMLGHEVLELEAGTLLPEPG
jgi:hypothetical protein